MDSYKEPLLKTSKTSSWQVYKLTLRSESQAESFSHTGTVSFLQVIPLLQLTGILVNFGRA